MSDTTNAGYRLERIYVSSQSYQTVPPEGLPDGTDANDRMIHFGWDWYPLGPRRFEVVVQVHCDPTTKAPESAEVRLLGVFEADSERPSVVFSEFIKVNGPAILFPYAREVISAMTGRGPHGAFHLRPINVVALTAGFDIEKTSGAQLLRSNPALASSFGLSITAQLGLPLETA